RPDTAPAMSDTDADTACARYQMSKTQCESFKEEEHHRTEILHAATMSGLPVYIERGKFHAKRMLQAAIEEGDTPKGRELLGNALHAVEDYYSHSNFVEAAILILEREHAGGVATTKLVDRLKKTR